MLDNYHKGLPPLPEPPLEASDDEVRDWAAQASWDAATGYTWMLDEWERIRGRLLRQRVRGPDTPEYLVTMAKGVAPVWDALDQDRALLDDEVWRLFEPEEAVLRALNAVEHYPPDSGWWSVNLAVLGNRHQLDAARLRDEAVWAKAECPWPSKARFYGRIIRYLDEGRTDLW